MTVVWVALGGMIGATGRYGVWRLAARVAPEAAFPWATFAVNLIGSFLLGFLLTRWDFRDPSAGPALRGFLAVGILGGFTTFSTFAFETVELLRSGHPGVAIANLTAQLGLGLLACWGGVVLGGR